MAAVRGVIIVVATMAALSHAAIATMFTVGAPNGGWDTTTDLQTWPSNLNFTVGDSLVFRYASNVDVVEVVKAEYDACTATKPIQSFTGGNTLVVLPFPGKYYFICSVSGQCAAGMKLEVDVADSGTAPGWGSTPRSPNLSSPSPSPMAPPPMSHTTPSPTTAPEDDAPSPSATPMASPPSTTNLSTSSPVPGIAQTNMTATPLASAAPASGSTKAVPAPPPKSFRSGGHGCCDTLAKSAVGFMVGVLLFLAL